MSNSNCIFFSGNYYGTPKPPPIPLSPSTGKHPMSEASSDSILHSPQENSLNSLPSSAAEENLERG